VHVQGGEVSGSIDESARHAISKLAHYHFPSTRRSAEYLLRMGEAPEAILGVGCPSSDIARQLDRTLDPLLLNSTGSGARIDPVHPFLLAIYHPVTTSYGGERDQIQQLLQALGRLAMPTVMMWPNIDAGSDHISKAIRVFRDLQAPGWLRTLTNLSPEHYLKVLGNACCAVGNSSSFVRDAGYFGTPVVLVGDRQEGREVDAHVEYAPPLAEPVLAAVRRQLERGRYAPSTLYGDGRVSERIAEGLARLEPYVQKRLHYIYEDGVGARVNGHARTGDRDGAGRVEGHPAKEHYDVAR
jgi:UDP-hydrolysing UDP-N-acetyl-D-glucosamine 2-epimerase